MLTVFIYALKDPRNGAVKYIGKAIDPRARLSKHFNEAKNRATKTHKDRWVRLLCSVGVLPEMEILDEVPSSQQSFFERAYIKAYREAGAKLTNLTDGGEGSVGFKHSEETIKSMTGRKYSPERGANISKALTGRVLSPEHCASLSKARTGKVFSAEHCANLSKALTGKIRSPEQCANISKAMTGKTLTPEHCANISKSLTGKYVGEKSPLFGRRPPEAAISAARAATKGVPKTPEHNAKNSAALKRIWAERKAAKNV